MVGEAAIIHVVSIGDFAEFSFPVTAMVTGICFQQVALVLYKERNV